MGDLTFRENKVFRALIVKIKHLEKIKIGPSEASRNLSSAKLSDSS